MAASPSCATPSGADGTASDLNSPARKSSNLILVSLVIIAPEVDCEIVRVPAVLADLVAICCRTRGFEKNPTLCPAFDLVVVNVLTGGHILTRIKFDRHSLQLVSVADPANIVPNAIAVYPRGT